jgi:hypothetical protein
MDERRGMRFSKPVVGFIKGLYQEVSMIRVSPVSLPSLPSYTPWSALHK